MRKIENQTFDEERAWYQARDLEFDHCRVDGPADGESAFKECSDISLTDCFLNLRYPLWHDAGIQMKRCEMTENCRAALWYSHNIQIEDCRLMGIKALRECADVKICHSVIQSPEFGWSSRNVKMSDVRAVSEYFMLRSAGLDFKGVEFQGKYSFQYIENAVFENCRFDTKDAFWHGKHIVCRNCTLKGEYLAWYSDDLVLENCTIIGTQPFCWCTNLVLKNCTMIDTDLSFEKSDVQAVLNAPIDSIKNPRSGRIEVPACKDIILDDPHAKGEIILTSKS